MIALIGLAAAQETAVAVKSTTGALTAAGVWAGVITMTLVLIVAIVRILPKLRELNIKSRLDELTAMSGRIAALELAMKDATKETREANERAHRSEINTTTLVAAIELLLGELRSIAPDSPVIAQVHSLLELVAASDSGIGSALLKLSHASVTGRG